MAVILAKSRRSEEHFVFCAFEKKKKQEEKEEAEAEKTVRAEKLTNSCKIKTVISKDFTNTAEVFPHTSSCSAIQSFANSQFLFVVHCIHPAESEFKVRFIVYL